MVLRSTRKLNELTDAGIVSCHFPIQTTLDVMTFILATDGRDEDVTSAFDRYRKYLQASKERFPQGAYALATSDWYYDPEDHRSPHDACLEQFDLSEISAIEPGKGRWLSLTVRLLGAHHDGYIELRYPRVRSYSFTLEHGNRGHRDWRYDEFRVTDQGELIHEIEWWTAGKVGHWMIEASDLEFRWNPKTEKTSS